MYQADKHIPFCYKALFKTEEFKAELNEACRYGVNSSEEVMDFYNQYFRDRVLHNQPLIVNGEDMQIKTPTDNSLETKYFTKDNYFHGFNSDTWRWVPLEKKYNLLLALQREICPEGALPNINFISSSQSAACFNTYYNTIYLSPAVLDSGVIAAYCTIHEMEHFKQYYLPHKNKGNLKIAKRYKLDLFPCCRYNNLQREKIMHIPHGKNQKENANVLYFKNSAASVPLNKKTSGSDKYLAFKEKLLKEIYYISPNERQAYSSELPIMKHLISKYNIKLSHTDRQSLQDRELFLSTTAKPEEAGIVKDLSVSERQNLVETTLKEQCYHIIGRPGCANNEGVKREQVALALYVDLKGQSGQVALER